MAKPTERTSLTRDIHGRYLAAEVSGKGSVSLLGNWRGDRWQGWQLYGGPAPAGPGRRHPGPDNSSPVT
jgi:hypothetical protein